MALVPALDLRPAADPRDHEAKAPASVEAEQAFLGALLYEPAALDLITVELLPGHFYEPFHGRLYKAIKETWESGDLPEPTFMAVEFGRDPAFLELGGIRYLADLVDRAPPAIRARQYAAHLVDYHNRRELLRVASELTIAAHAGDTTSIKMLDHLEAEVMKIRLAASEPGELITARQAALTTLDEIEEEYRSGRAHGVKTGLESFDEGMHGLPPTWLITIGGRPSMGKTALMRAAMYGAAERNRARTFAIFSIEMPARELSERALAAASAREEGGWFESIDNHSRAISMTQLGRSNISPEFEMPRLREMAERLPDNLVIFDRPELTISDIRRAVWLLKSKGDLAAIAVDYLQLMSRPETRGRTDAALIGDITAGLKRLALEAKIAIVLVSQLNRGVDNREDKRPQLSDLRESGSIEQDSNVVIFPFREAYYLERSKPEEGDPDLPAWEDKMRRLSSLMEVIVSKNRQGALGKTLQRYVAKFDFVENHV